jgi:hypothetical protein
MAWATSILFHGRHSSAGDVRRTSLPPPLPLPPPTIPRRVNDTAPYTKRIPQLLWISYRTAPTNVSDLSPHISDVVARNPTWDVYLYGDKEQRAFMHTHFANTSILWVYNLINPRVGVMFSDIFRYCLLYTYGGVYLDDDASFKIPLGQIVRPNDSLVLTNEPAGYVDRYAPWHHLSEHHMQHTCRQRQSQQQQQSCDVRQLFMGRNVAQWMILAAPGNALLRHAIDNVADLFYWEYRWRLPVWVSEKYTRVQLLFHTTGPAMLTATARAFVLAHPTSPDVPRMTGDIMFKSIGAKPKHKDHAMGFRSHYTVAMLNGAPMLVRYAPKNDSAYYHGRFVLVVEHPVAPQNLTVPCGPEAPRGFGGGTAALAPPVGRPDLVHGHNQSYFRVVNSSVVLQYTGSCSWLAAYLTARNADPGQPFAVETFTDATVFRTKILAVLQEDNGGRPPTIVQSPSVPMPPGRPNAALTDPAGKSYFHLVTRPVPGDVKYSCFLRGFADYDSFLGRNFTEQDSIMLPKQVLPEVPFDCQYPYLE